MSNKQTGNVVLTQEQYDALVNRAKSSTLGSAVLLRNKKDESKFTLHGNIRVDRELLSALSADLDASPTGAVELFHGYTYSGIPVAVAAALAVQDIFEKEEIFKRSKEMSPYFLDGIFSLKDLTGIDNIRGYGMMAGVDMKLKEKPGRAGFECFKACYETGVNFKATGDCLIIAPQFICEKKHIDEIIEKLKTGISNYMKK